MRLSYRPHCASCPSVCQSISLYHTAHNSKTKKCRKIKSGIDVSHDRSKWSANFQLKRSKVKLTGHEKPRVEVPVATKYSRRQLQTRPAIVRPNLLSAPEMLGRWATGRVAACHVGTRCTFLFGHRVVYV